jgi:hypothetical protein
MSLIQQFPRIRQIRDEEVEFVIREAQEDGHATLGVSHVIERNEALIGHLSVNAVPLNLVWMHTKRALVRDSFAMLNFVENCYVPGTVICVPCKKESPFFPLMEKNGGFVSAGEITLFIKKV